MIQYPNHDSNVHVEVLLIAIQQLDLQCKVVQYHKRYN